VKSILYWMKNHPKFMLAFVFWGSYFGIYIALSAAGRYTASCGETIYAPLGNSWTDHARWQPLGVRWDVWDPWTYRSLKRTDATRRNFLSFVFAPLIRLDRAYWHPTYSLPDDHTMPDARWTE
jgi:hypothetical protein